MIRAGALLLATLAIGRVQAACEDEFDKRFHHAGFCAARKVHCGGDAHSGGFASHCAKTCGLCSDSDPCVAQAKELTVACSAAGSHAPGVPASCTPHCAGVFLPFKKQCAHVLASVPLDLSGLSAQCEKVHIWDAWDRIRTGGCQRHVPPPGVHGYLCVNGRHCRVVASLVVPQKIRLLFYLSLRLIVK